MEVLQLVQNIKDANWRIKDNIHKLMLIVELHIYISW